MPRDKAQLAPDVVLAELSGGTGRDTSDAPQGAILKGVGNEGGLELTDPRMFASTADASVVNSVVETTLKAAGVGSAVLLANMATVGRSLRLTAGGIMDTAAVPGNLTLRIKANATVPAQNIAAAPVANLVSRLWLLTVTLTVRAIGINGLINAAGEFKTKSANTATATMNAWEVNRVVPFTFNTTIDQTFDLTAQWATADPANSITCTNFLLELL